MIRDYTYLTFTNFIYIRAKGLIWCYNGLTNPNNIDKSAGDAINEIYTNIVNSKPLIIDCNGISGITDHAWDILFTSIEKNKREVHFLNTGKIVQKINAYKSEFCTSLDISSNETTCAIFNKIRKITSIEDTITEIDSHLTKSIKEFIGESFYEYPDKEMKALPSTPICSNGEFDAALLASNPESFYWISIRMADIIEQIIQEFRVGGMSSPTKLLTVSLRSSPFAAAAGLLLGLQIETVDHFGPIFKNHETDNSLSSTNEYIYVGDFTVGGTEIKISKTYAHMRNAKLNHAIVIASLFEKELFKEFKLHPLANLKDCCSLAKYSLNIN